MVQTSIRIPSIKKFNPIGIDNKKILPYPIKHVNGDDYCNAYFSGIGEIETLQRLYPQYNFFIPSSVEIGHLYRKTGSPFLVGTGTVILRPNKQGYADRRQVKYRDESPVKLSHPVIANHGESWITINGKNFVIIDESKLQEYPEIAAIKKNGCYYIQGFDEKDRGVPTKFGNKPKEEYDNSRVWVNPNLLVAPLYRGSCHPFKVEERSYGSNLAVNPMDDWIFPLGSETTT